MGAHVYNNMWHVYNNMWQEQGIHMHMLCDEAYDAQAMQVMRCRQYKSGLAFPLWHLCPYLYVTWPGACLTRISRDEVRVWRGKVDAPREVTLVWRHQVREPCPVTMCNVSHEYANTSAYCLTGIRQTFVTVCNLPPFYREERRFIR